MPSEDEKRAHLRARQSPTGIGAAFERTVSLPSEDGQRFRLWVSDGERAGVTEARLSRTESVTLDEIPMLTLERVVERFAGRLPVETRLDDLLEEGAALRSTDFRPQDFLAAENSLA